MYLRKLKEGKKFVFLSYDSGMSYDIKKQNGIISCNCFAYKACKYPKEQKFCKHILASVDPRYFGNEVPSELINRTKIA